MRRNLSPRLVIIRTTSERAKPCCAWGWYGACSYLSISFAISRHSSTWEKSHICIYVFSRRGTVRQSVYSSCPSPGLHSFLPGVNGISFKCTCPSFPDETGRIAHKTCVFITIQSNEVDWKTPVGRCSRPGSSGSFQLIYS